MNNGAEVRLEKRMLLDGVRQYSLECLGEAGAETDPYSAIERATIKTRSAFGKTSKDGVS
jgi:hypothetical protein